METKKAKPKKLSATQILLWILCLIGISLLILFFHRIPLSYRPEVFGEYSNYIGAIVGSIIGGLCTVLALIITLRIERDKWVNEVREQRTLLVNQMMLQSRPFLTIRHKKRYFDISRQDFEEVEIGDGIYVPIYIFISIKNVGLGVIHSVKILDPRLKLYLIGPGPADALAEENRDNEGQNFRINKNARQQPVSASIDGENKRIWADKHGRNLLNWVFETSSSMSFILLGHFFLEKDVDQTFYCEYEFKISGQDIYGTRYSQRHNINISAISPSMHGVFITSDPPIPGDPELE